MKCISLILAAALLLTTGLADEKKKPSNTAALPDGFRAVIVVTGLRLDEAAKPPVKDLAVGEGAVVRVTKKGGKSQEKSAKAFTGRTEKNGGGTFFSADFGIELGGTYEVTMTFLDGTVILVDDFRLPVKWKTHFFYHSTRGELTPSSILRIGTDPASKLRCHIYSVFPVDCYRSFGGTQAVD